MTKVITYGTYDLLHYGHIRLLERAKELGDYLIVGVTADDFDKTRGKINVQQSLMDRVEAVRATGLADEIIIEEYEGQKIDDIKRYGVDIFTVGSDWVGHFDYLNEFCKVVYLDRTQGVSSTQIRSEEKPLRFGFAGITRFLSKYRTELQYVNGTDLVGLYSAPSATVPAGLQDLPLITDDYQKLLDAVDVVYIAANPADHYALIRQALENQKHVLCESPVTLSVSEYNELCALAENQHCVLMDGIKTAYATAFYRMQLLVKSGVIGEVVSVDATCTSLSDANSLTAWAPTALLPIFQLLGTAPKQTQIVTRWADAAQKSDSFTKISFVFDHAVASAKVGNGVKSEGELIISGTKGYIYVPAPWWKTDYFEVRFEDPANNKRYFYQLDGEGIRYELVNLVKKIKTGTTYSYISQEESKAIVSVMEQFYSGNNITI